MKEPAIERKFFDNQQERNQWLNDHFPERECSNTPGLFVTPDGTRIAVRFLEVTVIGPRPDRKARP